MIKAGLKTARHPNLFLGTGEDSGILFLWNNTSLPDLGASDRAFGFQSTTPKYWNGSGWTTIGSGGGTATTWDDLYAGDKNLTIDSTTLTFAGTHSSNDVFTITNATGSGDCIQITNSGTGYDIEGTSGTWYVSKTGAAVFTSGQIDAITSSASLTIDATGAGTITLGATSTGAITLTRAVTATASITITGGAGSDVFTITAGDAVLTEGSLTITDDDSAAALTVTNDAATTTTGIVSFVGTKITSGTLLTLTLDGSELSGGYYAKCIDSDDSGVDFSIAENGATVIAGSASGTAALTLTAGDFVVTDGQTTITRAGDDAVAFTVTNNSAATASAIVFAGSGTFTGSTTTSFFTVTPSGLTSGTAIYLPLAALVNGKGLHVTSGATQTTGSLLYVQDTGNNCAITSGTIATFDETAAAITSTVNRTGSTVSIASSRTTTTGTIADDFDNLSISRTVVKTGGAASSAGAMLKLADTLTTAPTATHVGIEIAMASPGTGAAISATHATATANGVSMVNNALTTGKLFNATSSGTSTTTGSLFYGSSATTGAVATNGLVSFQASGNYTSTSNVGLLTVIANATTSGTIASFWGNALTDGVGVLISSSSTGITSGSLLSVSTATTGAVATNGVVSLVSSGAHTSTSNCGFVHISDATATGTAVDLAVNSLTSGIGLYIASSGTGTTSGSLIRVSSATTGAVATNGIFEFIGTGAYTSTSNMGLFHVSGAATLTGTIAKITGTALTSGTALYISTAAATLTTGYYIQCYDGAANDFSVGAAGATVIAGSAVGTAALTVSAGDFLLSAGKFITETDTDTAVALAVTQNAITGKVTTSTSDLAASTTETITVTNNRCAATSRIYALISGKGTGGEMIVVNAVPGAGSFTIDCRNISTSTAMTSAYQVTYFIINS